jgi:hypothetical protein
MFRIRNLVIIVLILALVYALSPPERKKRWKDKGREFVRALAISLVIYWIYMIFRYLYRHGS